MITFDTTATVSQGITNVLEDFRDSVNKMKPGGDTAVWDALALANDQLSEYGQQFPEAKKRIICLSDGEDNKSSKKHYEACWSLVVCAPIERSVDHGLDITEMLTHEQQNKIVVDSYCIGNEDNIELRTVSYLYVVKGSCFWVRPTYLLLLARGVINFIQKLWSKRCQFVRWSLFLINWRGRRSSEDPFRF